MRLLLLYFALVSIISKEIVHANIKDFIVTEENEAAYLSETDDFMFEDDEYFDELAEYDSCGYENPAEKYFSEHIDESYIANAWENMLQTDESSVGEYGDMLTSGDAAGALESLLREQEMRLNQVQEMFKELSANPRFAKIFQRVLSGQSLDMPQSCSKGSALDVFTNSYGDF